MVALRDLELWSINAKWPEFSSKCGLERILSKFSLFS